MSQSVDSLVSLCDRYRNLGPVFDRLRRLYPGYSLIPEALSPLLPGIAYGHHIESTSIIATLEQDISWQLWSPQIKAAYECFCTSSCNRVLWLAWNHWDPTAPPADQRKIQVVVSPDNALATLAQSTAPFENLTNLDLSPASIRLSSSRAQSTSVATAPLDFNVEYVEGLWQSTFRPSFVSFTRDLRIETIVDYIRVRFLADDPLDTALLTPKIFRFDSALASSSPGELNKISGERDVWNWVNELIKSSSETGSTALIEAWITAAKAFQTQPDSIPEVVFDAVRGFAKQFNIERLDEAYVILQHILWTKTALNSSNQYVLPVASGSYFSAIYFGTVSPLSEVEIAGWHQLAVQLFTTLTVHSLDQVVKQSERQHLADEQRVVLAHTIPKFAFKPLEYFATRLASGSITKAIEVQEIARTLLYLTSRGQAALAEYAPPPVRHRSDSGMSQHNNERVDLSALCDTLMAVFESIREFLIGGHVDRGLKRATSKLTFRQELSTNSAISLKNYVASSIFVEGNPGLLTLHLWNLVDNAFRYADFATALKKRVPDLRDVLAISFSARPVGTNAIELQVANNGNGIEPHVLEHLNALFHNRPGTAEFRHAQKSLEMKGGLTLPIELEHERSGIGLRRFAEYLWAIWEGKPMPESFVGTASNLSQGCSFSFLLPI